MSNRRQRLAEQLGPVVIGAELVTARQNRVPWKLLVRRYGLCRARLYQIWRAALAGPEKMSIDIAAVEHPGERERQV
jgi:hypothetical protein